MTEARRMCIRGRVGDKGGEFSDDELEEIIEKLEGRRRERAQSGAPDEGMRGLVDDAAREAYDERLKAAITKRNRQIDILRDMERDGRIAKFSLEKSTAGTGAKVKETIKVGVGGKKTVERAAGGMSDVQGFEAQMARSNKRVDEAHVSVESQTDRFQNEFLGEMYAELKREGLLDYLQARRVLGVGFGAGPLDRPISAELWELNKADGKPGVSGSDTALKIARIIHGHMDHARIRMNRLGAWIQELTGYIATQSHDRLKLQRAGFEAWFDDVIPILDVRRTFGKSFDDPTHLREAMMEVYQTLTAGDITLDLPVGPQIDLGVNVAQKVSHHRVLHFQSSDAWMDYNDKYGSGSLFSAIQNTMGRGAKIAGLMSIYGTNPDRAIARDIARLKKLNQTNPEVLKRLDSEHIKRMIAVTTGEADQVVDPVWATRMQMVREWESVTGLGGAMLSMTTDPLNRANQLRYNGLNALESMRAAIVDLVAGDKGAAEDLAFGFQALRSDVSNRFHSTDTGSAKASKAAAIGMNMTLMPFADNIGEKAFVATIGHQLWRNRDTAWGGLDEMLRGTLALYGIDEPRWNLIRRYGQAAHENGEGGVLSGRMLRNIPDSEILTLLNRKRASSQLIDNERDRLEGQLRMYYSSQAEVGMARPGVKIKALTTMGGKRGTFVGEAARSAFLWKGFSLNFMHRVMGQFTQEDGYVPTLGGLMAMPKSSAMQMGGLTAGLLVAGYGAMVLKDLSKGRTPRDPRDAKTWAAAMLQGGGLGIYGDFVFGQVNRYGAGPVTSLLGPVASDADAVVKLLMAMRTGDASGLEAYNLVKTNLPFINLFYTRAAFDYMILYRIQEWMNPGSLRRMERRVKEENGNEFILPPSEVIN